MRVTTTVVALCVTGTALWGAPQPERVRQPVRQSVVDLDIEAKSRRPGQVLPGDASASVPTVTNPAPAPVIEMPAPTIPGSETPIRPIETSGSAAPAPARLSPAPAPAPTRAPVRAPVLVPGPSLAALPEYDRAIEQVLGYGPVRAMISRIDGPAHRVQWRATSAYDGVRGPWHTPRRGEQLNGRVEIRTGLGVVCHVEVEGGADIIVSRLSRVTIEQALLPNAETDLSVDLRRGRVGLSPRAGQRVLIRTADSAAWATSDLTFDFDAFIGTTRGPLFDY